MIRPVFLSLILWLAPALAVAGSMQESILSQLRAQGFSGIEVSRTLLGRIRIVAQSDTLDREIIFNPATGELLRDYWHPRDDKAAGGAGFRLVDPMQHGAGGATGGDSGGDSGGEGDGDGGGDGDSGGDSGGGDD